MKYIPVCISLFFMKIMNFVKPFFIRANHFIRSISGVFSYSVVNNPKEFMRIREHDSSKKNDTIIAGYMEHNPKRDAFRKHSLSF